MDEKLLDIRQFAELTHYSEHQIRQMCIDRKIKATKIASTRYLRDDGKLVFLGDYVDRGRDSAANINYLLCLKLAYPDKLFL